MKTLLGYGRETIGGIVFVGLIVFLAAPLPVTVPAWVNVVWLLAVPLGAVIWFGWAPSADPALPAAPTESQSEDSGQPRTDTGEWASPTR